MEKLVQLIFKMQLMIVFFNDLIYLSEMFSPRFLTYIKGFSYAYFIGTRKSVLLGEVVLSLLSWDVRSNETGDTNNTSIRVWHRVCKFYGHIKYHIRKYQMTYIVFSLSVAKLSSFVPKELCLTLFGSTHLLVVSMWLCWHAWSCVRKPNPEFTRRAVKIVV